MDTAPNARGFLPTQDYIQYLNKIFILLKLILLPPKRKLNSSCAPLCVNVIINVFSGDELFSDTFPIKLIDGLYYEVEGKVSCFFYL